MHDFLVQIRYYFDKKSDNRDLSAPALRFGYKQINKLSSIFSMHVAKWYIIKIRCYIIMQGCVASMMETVHLTVNRIFKRENMISGIPRNKRGKNR